MLSLASPPAEPAAVAPPPPSSPAPMDSADASRFLLRCSCPQPNRFVLFSNTIVCVIYCQSKDAEVMLKMGNTTDKREQYRLMRDAMEKRFIRVAKGSLVGGIQLGMFTATFFGAQNLLINTHGVHDVFNIAAAGSATAAAFGLICMSHIISYHVVYYLVRQTIIQS
ncbi:hypothetical protein BS78_03G113700 [Paspalum vaginatum]|nr:hypothetical protein BS78_03G113700 [Paspalum vaginatum]